ncbi:HAD family hydrolase [Mycoplasmoides alvi]|uniref:HAD family hydrolase n=1 Tax=Mycoplasmoides alvi TaxID=78580 RepID=UPI00051C3888|nr:HAD family hydrolase [Mycoplasmoides alvi]
MNFDNIRNDVKYLLFDLDGTLVNNERYLTDENAKLSTLLPSLNLKHSIITGRPSFMFQKEIDEIKPTIPIIACNGAHIFDGNEILYSTFIDQNVVNELIHYLIKEKLNFYLYTSTQIYTFPNDFAHVNRWKEIIQKLPLNYQWKIDGINFYNFHDPVTKFLVSSSEQDVVFNKIKSIFRDKLYLAKSTSSSIDIGKPMVDKGSGLVKLMQKLNIDPSQIMVFGDGGNDIPMFKIAKYSVALSNAAQFVKDAATFITDLDNNNSGVYHFIKKIWNL